MKTLSKQNKLLLSWHFLSPLFVIAIAIGMSSCKQDAKVQAASQPVSTNSNKALAANSDTVMSSQNNKINQNLLKGVWGRTLGENASFEISKNTIYYVDADRRLKQTIVDSTLIVFEENGDTSFSSKIVKLNEDSLIMVGKESLDTTVFLRFK